MSPIALITGATSGFGKATAEKFAAHGYDVIITGRRAELLQEVAEKITAQHNVKVLPLSFDVRNRNSVHLSLSNLSGEWQNIHVLVNNAGLALGKDYFDEADMEDWETMIDTNLKGVLYVSRAVIPYMIHNKKGHIINMGSVAAKDVYEKGNVYCATKSSLDALSHGMRIDLLRHGIRVTAIHPGAAETEFSMVRFKGNAEAAKAVYKGYKSLSAEDIAGVIYYCASLPEHVCINDLTLTPTAQADAFYFHKEE